MPKLMDFTKIVDSQSGSILLMTLIMTFIAAVMAFVFLNWQTSFQTARQQQRIKFTAESIRQNIMVQLYNTEAWKATAGTDSCLLDGVGCPAGAGGPLTLKTADGAVYVDSNDSADGFDFYGKRCDPTTSGGYRINGNDRCPFQYRLNWSAVGCVSGKCEIRVVGSFSFRPETESLNRPLKTSNFSIDLIRGKEGDSLQSACSSLSGSFVQGQTHCATNGEVPTCPSGQALKVVVYGQPPVCESVVPANPPCAVGTAARGISSTGEIVCAAP